MRLMKDMLHSLVHALRIKKSILPESREEQWKRRGVKFGKNFDGPDSIIDYCYGHLVTIGDNVTISGTTILAHDGSTKKALGYVKVAPVKIGNDVFIGYGSIVLPGVTIGSKVIVGAGTICSKNIPDNVVVVGQNFGYHILCSYDEYIKRQKERMEKLPISMIQCTNRSEESWKKWKECLQKYGSGFDL